MDIINHKNIFNLIANTRDHCVKNNTKITVSIHGKDLEKNTLCVAWHDINKIKQFCMPTIYTINSFDIFIESTLQSIVTPDIRSKIIELTKSLNGRIIIASMINSSNIGTDTFIEKIDRYNNLRSFW